MTYKLIKERATAAGIRDAYFLKIYANDTMIEIKPARESMTEQEIKMHNVIQAAVTVFGLENTLILDHLVHQIWDLILQVQTHII